MTEDPGIDVSDLPREARRLAGELSAVVVLLRPDAGDGSLRIGVAVPGPLTAQVPATAVLDRVLAVTGGRGGGSPAFAQGGGAEPGDLPRCRRPDLGRSRAGRSGPARWLRGAFTPGQCLA